MKNVKAFLAGLIFIFGFAVSLEAFAKYPAPYGDWQIYSTNRSCGISPIDLTAQEVQDMYDNADNCVAEDVGNLTSYWLPRCQGDYAGGCRFFTRIDEPPHSSGTNQAGDVVFSAKRIITLYYRVEPLNCQTDTIPGADIVFGGATGNYSVGGCKYTCSINMTLLDGQTTWQEATQCKGQGVESEQNDGYIDELDGTECSVFDDLGRCLDMPETGCESGQTYGQVNGKNVCVGSGTSTDGLDPGSAGEPGAGGDSPASGGGDTGGGDTGGGDTGGGDTGGGGTCVPSETDDCSGEGEGDGSGDGGGECVPTETETCEGSGDVGEFKGHGEPASWWESKYPEGAAGIASKFSDQVANGPFMSMLDPLKSLPTNGGEPVWSFNVNLGPMGNFGSVDLDLPSGVWAFIRFCILFTAAMTVRKLIFGG